MYYSSDFFRTMLVMCSACNDATNIYSDSGFSFKKVSTPETGFVSEKNALFDSVLTTLYGLVQTLNHVIHLSRSTTGSLEAL